MTIMSITGQQCERTVRCYLHRKRDRALYNSSMDVSTALKRHVEIVPSQLTKDVEVQNSEVVIQCSQIELPYEEGQQCRSTFASCSFSNCAINISK